jgi:hypothetical protein
VSTLENAGRLIFRQACKLGLEGIVSKRLSAPYRSGRSRDWLKVRNPDSPATIRAGKPNGLRGAASEPRSVLAAAVAVPELMGQQCMP